MDISTEDHRRHSFLIPTFSRGLMSIRSRGQFSRPFTTLLALEKEVRKVLRQDVEQLGQLLLAFNLLFAPIVVGISGILVYRRRNQSRAV